MNRIIKKWYYALTKSENIAHIKEHLAALDFTMNESDIEHLNNYKIQYNSPNIDWEKTWNWYGIDQLSNIFDEEYNKQQ